MVRLHKLFPVLLLGISASAAVVNLSGTVTSGGKPLAGAIVTLVGQKMSDTTNTQGAYSLVSGGVPVLATSPVPQLKQISFDKGMVSFGLDKASPVRIELFDMRGTLLKRVVDKTLASGEYRFNAMTQSLATSMLAIRVYIGQQSATFRYIPLQSSRQIVSLYTPGISSSAEGGLAKVQATIDTLLVTATKYTAKKVAISSYETSVDVTLDSITLEKFSFFVTSMKALFEIAGNDKGLGGDFRYGKTGTGAGLLGAGSSVKQWRAFLSVKQGPDGKQVNAIDRIGAGPWYDRIGRIVSPDIAGLLADRPAAHSAIKDDLPNEDGVPNHRPDPNQPVVDNHMVVTGSDAKGVLYTSTSSTNATCDDWTSVTTSSRPRAGLSWPQGTSGSMKGGMKNWISALDVAGCQAGIDLDESTGPGVKGIYTIGNGGGYGAFYCFALVP